MNTRALDRARRELAEAIVRRMELDLLGKIVQMKYLARFGELEIREHRLRYREMVLTAKLQRIEACLARKLPVRMDRIHADLDEDLRSYAEYIDGMEALWKKSMRQYRAEPQMKKERARLRGYFYPLVLQWSPDVHPDIGERERKRYREAQDAFRKGDLEALQALCEEKPPARDDTPAADDRAEETMRLEERTREIRAWNQLRVMGAPFDYRELLADEARIEEKMREIRALIARYETDVIERQKRVAEMMRMYGRTDR